MAFAHQYTHAGTASGSLQSSQVMLSTKSAHTPSSPHSIDQTRTLIQESGLPLLHFLPRMNGLAESVYGQGPLTPNGLGVEPSAFYPMGSPPGHLPGSPDQWKSITGQTPVVYPFDPMLAVHPYASFYGGIDLNNAARRKNATRETTSALKAWLYEHRKNPYPTKGEKIMLAIITKMTLTQVSTWFANARRRLKKESKSGWNGKERDLDDSDFEADGEERTNEKNDQSEGTLLNCSGIDSDDEDIKVTSDLSDISDEENEQEKTSSETGSRLQLPLESSTTQNPAHFTSNNRLDRPNSSVGNGQINDSVNQGHPVVNPSQTKPKIWSIEEIMNKDAPRTKVTPNLKQTYSTTEHKGNIFVPRDSRENCKTEDIQSRRYSQNGQNDKTIPSVSNTSTETMEHSKS